MFAGCRSMTNQAHTFGMDIQVQYLNYLDLLCCSIWPGTHNFRVKCIIMMVEVYRFSQRSVQFLKYYFWFNFFFRYSYIPLLIFWRCWERRWIWRFTNYQASRQRHTPRLVSLRWRGNHWVDRLVPWSLWVSIFCNKQVILNLPWSYLYHFNTGDCMHQSH